LKDAIQDGQNGFLVAAGDVEAYAQRIREILRNPDAKEAFGIQAKAITKKNHAWPLIARRYLDAMRALRHDGQI